MGGCVQSCIKTSGIHYRRSSLMKLDQNGEYPDSSGVKRVDKPNSKQQKGNNQESKQKYELRKRIIPSN